MRHTTTKLAVSALALIAGMTAIDGSAKAGTAPLYSLGGTFGLQGLSSDLQLLRRAAVRHHRPEHGRRREHTVPGHFVVGLYLGRHVYGAVQCDGSRLHEFLYAPTGSGGALNALRRGIDPVDRYPVHDEFRCLHDDRLHCLSVSRARFRRQRRGLDPPRRSRLSPARLVVLRPSRCRLSQCRSRCHSTRAPASPSRTTSWPLQVHRAAFGFPRPLFAASSPARSRIGTART